MERNRIINIVINVSILLLGLWILVNPNVGLNFLRFYLGFILIIGAVSFYYMYTNQKETKLLAQSILLLIIGLFFIFSSKFSSISLGLTLALWIMFEAFVELNLALLYRKFNISAWIFVLVLAIISIIASVYILANLTLSAMLLIQISAVFTMARSLLLIIDQLMYKKVYEIEMD